MFCYTFESHLPTDDNSRVAEVPSQAEQGGVAKIGYDIKNWYANLFRSPSSSPSSPSELKEDREQQTATAERNSIISRDFTKRDDSLRDASPQIDVGTVVVEQKQKSAPVEKEEESSSKTNDQSKKDPHLDREQKVASVQKEEESSSKVKDISNYRRIMFRKQNEITQRMEDVKAAIYDISVKPRQMSSSVNNTKLVGVTQEVGKDSSYDELKESVKKEDDKNTKLVGLAEEFAKFDVDSSDDELNESVKKEDDNNTKLVGLAEESSDDERKVVTSTNPLGLADEFAEFDKEPSDDEGTKASVKTEESNCRRMMFRKQNERNHFVEYIKVMNNNQSFDSDGHMAIDDRLIKSRRRSSVHNAKLLGLADELADFDIDSSDDEEEDDEEEVESRGEKEMTRVNDSTNLDPVFESKFNPSEMRCLALVAHNHMKPAMKSFVLANKNLLRKFKLTGTCTTMTMLQDVFGDDPSVEYGPTCTSGPLGGDAELVAIMCTANLGGCVFFQDPMDAHPHAADIECLNRQANVHNVLMMPNPATAYAIMNTFRIALKSGRSELIPSFFTTLESPSVAEYKIRQAKVVEENK